MWAIVGSNFYCPLLNSKSALICIVGKQQKDPKPRSLNFCFFTNQRVLFFAMPFLPHKGFALTGRLKTAKCQYLWSRANCQGRMFVKQPNRRLQQLLAVENKTILQQLNRQLSTWCSNSHQFFIHITLACVHKCFTLKGNLKSAKNECLWNSVEKTAEAFTYCRRKYLCSRKNRQISTWYVLTP